MRRKKGLNWPLTKLSVIAITAWSTFAPAVAQDYPSRPITMIVPFPAGGPSDVVGRIVADHMQSSLGKPIIVENVTGASGNIGVGRAARAAGDGYTLSLGTFSTHVLNGAIFNLQHDLLRDFQPVSLLPTMPLMIVTKKYIPAKDLRELIAWLKANPNKASAGTAGLGSSAHVAGVYFQKEAGAQFQFVPYRGVGLAMQDLVAGRIDLMIDLPANSLPQVRAGTIKALAITSSHRLAAASDIPTVDEAGLPKFHVSSWNALFVPKATPKSAISKLNAAVVDALADPVVQQRLIHLAQEIPARDQQTPEALGAFQRAEIEKWWPIVKAAGIKAE